MDWLEITKKELHDNEAITNDVAAQAHLENWALKLFLYADKNDRAANFSNNVVQSFYTAQVLYNILTLFGELSVEAAQNRKYAQWKASYIHNCLMNGETPVPGPMKEEDEENNSEALNDDGKLTVFIFLSSYKIVKNFLLIKDFNFNVAPAAENLKDNTPQNIPSIPANPPTTRTQSFDAEDNTEYKTESKSNNMIYKYIYYINISIYKRKNIIKSNL